MANVNKPQDTLGTVSDYNGFSSGWDYKGEYMSDLSQGEEGYERFATHSATPDSTALFAGPARFSGINANSSTSEGKLIPIGLTDGLQVSMNVQLSRLFEIGSSRSFFTRGKEMPSLSLGKFLADQKNILAALRQSALDTSVLNDEGTKAPGSETSPDIMLNLGSEYFSVPFGMLVVFKTRGARKSSQTILSTSTSGKILTGVYLEYCMFSNYGFGVSSGAPSIMESVGIEFDRVVPVSFT